MEINGEFFPTGGYSYNFKGWDHFFNYSENVEVLIIDDNHEDNKGKKEIYLNGAFFAYIEVDPDTGKLNRTGVNLIEKYNRDRYLDQERGIYNFRFINDSPLFYKNFVGLLGNYVITGAGDDWIDCKKMDFVIDQSELKKILKKDIQETQKWSMQKIQDNCIKAVQEHSLQSVNDDTSEMVPVGVNFKAKAEAEAELETRYKSEKED